MKRLIHVHNNKYKIYFKLNNKNSNSYKTQNKIRIRTPTDFKKCARNIVLVLRGKSFLFYYCSKPIWH